MSVFNSTFPVESSPIIGAQGASPSHSDPLQAQATSADRAAANKISFEQAAKNIAERTYTKLNLTQSPERQAGTQSFFEKALLALGSENEEFEGTFRQLQERAAVEIEELSPEDAAKVFLYAYNSVKKSTVPSRNEAQKAKVKEFLKEMVLEYQKPVSTEEVQLQLPPKISPIAVPKVPLQVELEASAASTDLKEQEVTKSPDSSQSWKKRAVALGALLLTNAAIALPGENETLEFGRNAHWAYRTLFLTGFEYVSYKTVTAAKAAVTSGYQLCSKAASSITSPCRRLFAARN